MSRCAYSFSQIAVILRDLAWPHKSQKFNLHHLLNIFTGFKMTVLTPKSGIWEPYGLSDPVYLKTQEVIGQKQPPELFYKKAVLKNFTKFTGKHLIRSLFFNKVKKSSRQRCFPVNFAKFLRTAFLEAVVRRFSVKKMFLKISRYWQVNTCVGVSF